LTLRAVRILLVDDSDAVRQALCSLLSAHVEFEIVCESVNGIGSNQQNCWAATGCDSLGH